MSKATLPSIVLAAAVGASAGAAPCSAPEYRQFDFWMGSWNVTTPDGKPAGTNRIEPILGGCALQERWTGAKGGQGTSLNFYDANGGVWHQVWIDGQGNPLFLRGGLKDGAMVLESDGPGPHRDRVTWTPKPDGSVRQFWETTEDGATWKTSFDGLYVRVESK